MPAEDLRGQLQSALGSAYTLERELAGGGMSRVFVAREEALGRHVVVKVLAPQLTEGVSAERFAREIRLAAALQEPHIVPVLAAGVAKDGLPYYTMPFVSGESLRTRMTSGRVPAGEAVSILHDVADALAYAHAHGVVHRDVKPENVLLSSRTAVVTDFGIAKALHRARTVSPDETAMPAEGLTQVGTSLGTPAYMAPEQAAGDPETDHRADIYAWGVMAYELLSGRHPFAGRTSPQALMAAHFSETPAPLPNDVPRTLAQLVARCLEKDPARRPASATELLETLDAVPPTSASNRASRRAAFAVAGGIVIVAAAVMSLRAREPSNVSAPPGRSVAVLPLANASGDTASAYFAAGLSEELTSAVAKLPGLRVIGGASASIAMGKGPVDPRAIGDRLHVTQVLEGSVRRSGAKVRIAARLTSTSDGTLTWAETYERDASDVFAVQAEIAGAVARALELRLAGADSARLARGGTRDTLAHELFLRARAMREQYGEQNIRQAIRLYERATERDPGFADAWAHIAEAWYNLSDEYIAPREAAVRSGEAADRALAIDPMLPMGRIAKTLTLQALRRTSARAAAADARRAADDAPNDPDVQTRAAWIVLAVDPAAAAALDARAVSLNPLSGVALAGYGFIRSYSDPVEAEQFVRRGAALLPDVGIAHGMLGASLLREGRTEEALAELERGRALGDRDLSGALAGVALARLGRRDEAKRRLAAFEEDRKKRYVIGDWVAKLCLAVGDRECALRWLERAAAMGSSYTAYVDVDGDFDALRGDPRFEAVRRSVGLAAPSAQ